MKKLYSLIGVLSLSALSSLASVVVPTSYTATPGQGRAESGSYNYFDDTGKQLTDGVTGGNYWAADLGHGTAYEWVGWLTVDPTITFQFDKPVTINTVNIDFNRAEGAGIYIPSSVTIGGTPFPLSQDALPNGSSGYLSFNDSWTGSSLTINLTRRTGVIAGYASWVFVDEVTFDGVSAVPEPSTIIAGALLLVPFGVSAIRYSLKTRVA